MHSLIACLCPPLAVYSTGKTNHLTANLLLTLFFYIPGSLHALMVVKRSKLDRRNELLMSIAERYYA